MSNEQRAAFLKDLLVVIEKHDADFICEDRWEGYPECGSDIRIAVEFGDYRTPSINFGKHIDRWRVKRLIEMEEGR